MTYHYRYEGEPLTEDQTRLAALFADTDLPLSQLAAKAGVAEDQVRRQLWRICRQLRLPANRDSLRAFMLEIELAPVDVDGAV